MPGLAKVVQIFHFIETLDWSGGIKGRVPLVQANLIKFYILDTWVEHRRQLCPLQEGPS